MSLSTPHDRRWFLQSLTVAIAAFSAPGAFAQQLVETATTTEGPFYPDKLPLDTDNDLLIINDAITPAVGDDHAPDRPRPRRQRASQSATRSSRSGRCDSTVPYLHTAGTSADASHDRNSRATAAFSPDATGPLLLPHDQAGVLYIAGDVPDGAYSLRHQPERSRVFSSQMLVEGEPGNARDGLLRKMSPRCAQDAARAFRAGAGVTARRARRTLRCRLGRTAAEDDAGQLRGVAAPLSRRGG